MVLEKLRFWSTPLVGSKENQAGASSERMLQRAERAPRSALRASACSCQSTSSSPWFLGSTTREKTRKTVQGFCPGHSKDSTSRPGWARWPQEEVATAGGKRIGRHEQLWGGQDVGIEILVRSVLRRATGYCKAEPAKKKTTA